MESLSTRDITVVQTKIRGNSTLLLSVYLDITWLKLIPDKLQQILTYTEEKGLAILLAADTNCHSSTFGPDTNKRGKQLELFIAKHNLTIENNSHAPTYESRGSETCIDVTLTCNLSVSVKNWRVNRDFNGSDHNNIEYHMEEDLMTIPSHWLWDKAEWVYFQKVVQGPFKIPKVISQEGCDQFVFDFYKRIENAMALAIPKSPPRVIDNNNPWWTRELQAQRHKLDTLYKQKKNKKYPHSTEVYNAFRNRYKKCRKS